MEQERITQISLACDASPFGPIGEAVLASRGTGVLPKSTRNIGKDS